MSVTPGVLFVSDILSLKAYYTAAYALLVYDYFLTLPAEVEFVWRSRKSWASALFLLNRYISIIFSTVVLISFHLPSFTICDQWAIAEFIYTVLTFTIAEMFLALRVYIITRKNFYLAVIFILQILAQLGLGLYIMSIPWRIVPVPPFANLLDRNALQICLLALTNLKLDIVYLSLTLAFDSLVLIVTLTVTITAAQQSPTKHWLKVIQNDGILYFMAIFSSTLIWLMFGVAARDGLKFINAIPDLIFTAIMINRLHLSLKKVGSKEEPVQVFRNEQPRSNADAIELQIGITKQTMLKAR